MHVPELVIYQWNDARTRDEPSSGSPDTAL
jgi:hypothetical protein